ncbi:MAG TPA: metabolite traffic protein EboE, partial [Rhodothermales bacterium]
MRLPGDDFFHLTYCSNVHPGESWMETFTNVEVYVPALKRVLAPEEAFGIGLRLSDRAARELLEEPHLARFQAWLNDNGLYVFTINGFPYGGFHRQVVKDAVYRPDWTDPERADYTRRLAQILARLLPEGVDGGISTSPVSYKRWHEPDAYDGVFAAAARNLAEVAADLALLRRTTGRYIHIDIEPEPDCLIENTAETTSFFEQWLLPVGGAHLSEKLGIPATDAHALLLDHV